MRDNEVYHRIEVAVKHASVDAENSEAFLEEGMW
jgi:hypothetical protein